MSAKFDPYHKWLAIPLEEQPANYYRLLGVRLFETDLEVISTAADQRMMLLRSFQSGQHAPISQAILNEVAAATRTLLDPNQRKVYDQKLRSKLSVGDGSKLAAATAGAEAAAKSAGNFAGGGLASQVSKLAVETQDLTYEVDDLTTAPSRMQAPQVPATSSRPPQKKPAATLADELPALSSEPTIDLEALAPPPTTRAAAPLGKNRPVAPAGPSWDGKKLAIYGGAAVLVLALGTLGYALFGGGGSTETAGNPPVDPPATGQRRPTPPPDPIDDPIEEPSGKSPAPKIDQPPKGDPKPPETPPEVKVPEHPDKEPVDPKPPVKTPTDPVAEPKPEEPPKVNLATAEGAYLPKAVTLPPLDDDRAVVLARYADPDLAKVTFLNFHKDAARMRVVDIFQPKKEEPADKAKDVLEPQRRWNLFVDVLRGQPTIKAPVAKIWVDDRALLFRWTAEAQAHATTIEQLRNCTLEIGVDSTSHTVALREPKLADAIKVDLSKKELAATVLVDLSPQLESLCFQFGGASKFPVPVKVAHESGAPVKTEQAFEFNVLNDNDRPTFTIATNVASEGKYTIAITPKISSPRGDFDLTVKTVAMVKDKSAAGVLTTQREFSRLENQLKVMERDKTRMENQMRKAGGGKAQSNLGLQVRKLNDDIAKTRNARDTALQAKVNADNLHKSVPAVEDLVRKLHNQAVVEYRLFAQVNGHEITLVQTPGYQEAKEEPE